MDNKNTAQDDTNTNTRSTGLEANDPNVILPGVHGGDNKNAGPSKMSSEEEKVTPVLVRSFHKDVDEIKNKEKHSKEAAQLRKQMSESQKEDIKSTIPQKASHVPSVPVKKELEKEIPKKEQETKKIPEAPTPPYKKAAKAVDQKKVLKSIPVPKKKQTPPSAPQKHPESISKVEESKEMPVLKDQKKQLLDIPVPKKPAQAASDDISAKFIDRNNTHIPEKEIIFPKPTVAGRTSGAIPKQPKKEMKDEKLKTEVAVPSKTSHISSDKKEDKPKPFPMKTVQHTAETKPSEEKKVEEKVLEKKPEEKPQKTYDVFDAMVSGEHVEDEKGSGTVTPEKEKEKEKETPPHIPTVEKQIIFKEKPPEKKIKEKTFAHAHAQGYGKVKEEEKKVEEPVGETIPAKITADKEEKQQTPTIPETHISVEELNTLKGDIVRIDSELKAFAAQKESILAKKDRVEKEKISYKTEVDTIKDRLTEKQKRENEITKRIVQIEQKETQTENRDERHTIEEERWKQEDMRADVARERLEIEGSYEKIITLIHEKEGEFTRAEESLRELEHQTETRTKEKEEKRSKVRLGEIENKKKEIEDIQVALLEEKRRLDRLHEDFESKEEQCLKERKLIEQEKEKATELADKKIFEEKILFVQKERREVEQKRWEAGKSLEVVLEKITRSNEHYNTVLKLEQEVRESLSKAVK